MNDDATQATDDVLDLTQYKGEWIARDESTKKIVGHNADMSKARDMAIGCGVSDPVLLYIPLKGPLFPHARISVRKA